MSHNLSRATRVNEPGDTAPLYEQVQKDLHHKILEGKFGPEGQLPSERDLCTYYKVSKVTVRRAISELVLEGFVYTIHGKGTFVVNGRHKQTYPDTIRFVTSEEILERGIMREILGAFGEQHPEFQVEPLVLTLNRRLQEFMTGGMVDLLAVSAEELPALISKGVFLDLTDLAMRDLDLQSYYPKPFEFSCMKSRVYSFPVTFSPMVIIYNRDHFREAGLDFPDDWNWETFLDYARRLTITGADGQISRYGFYLSGHISSWPNFLLQNNGGVFDVYGNFILDSSQSLEALRFCRDLMLEHRVAPIGAPFQEDRPFLNGLTSMTLRSYYLFPMNNANAGLDWDLQRLPQGRTRGSVYRSVNLGIHRESKHPELAWELLKFFISPLAQRLFLLQRQQWPTLRSVVEDEDVPPWVHKQQDLFWEEMAVAQPIYWGDDGIRMQRLVSEGLQMAWLGIETPEAACADIRRHAGLADNPLRF